MENLLQIKELTVKFYLKKQIITAVEQLNLSLRYGQTLVIAGESGSGKTVTAYSITKILPPTARIVSGKIEFLGRDILTLNEQDLIKIRGRQIAYVFQEPVSFLNPVYTVGSQIVEAIILHQAKTKKTAKREAIELLNQVKIAEPQKIFYNYPHQLSGGMNQRVFIAMALACRPILLIADEPTTSLDVMTEIEILQLLMDLKKQLGFSLIFITHNLSIAKRIADRICIMYKGKVVEEGTCEDIFNSAAHFHTKELIAAYEKIGVL